MDKVVILLLLTIATSGILAQKEDEFQSLHKANNLAEGYIINLLHA